MPNATDIYGTRPAIPGVQIPGIPTDLVDGRAAAWKYGASAVAPATAGAFQPNHHSISLCLVARATGSDDALDRVL